MSVPAINQHATLVTKLTTAALADIEGLDPNANGFCRACDLKDEKSNGTLMGTFENLKRHIFVGTHTPATEWDKVADNVVGLKEISKAVKSLADSRVTAFFDPLLKEGEVRRLMFDWNLEKNSTEMTEVSGVDAKDTAFAVSSSSASSDPTRQLVDSEKIFVFVCSHTKRDGRCGYCGPAIVDLMRQDLKAKKADDKIFVYPCSHVGGHAYAGNVLVYGKNGGIVFGNFCPSDVETLVNHLITKGHTKDAPEGFGEKVRGFLGAAPPTAEAGSSSL